VAETGPGEARAAEARALQKGAAEAGATATPAAEAGRAATATPAAEATGVQKGAEEAGGRPLVFLDFDGVICDSLPECYAVSRAAFYGLYLGSPEPETAQGDEALFRRLRPYIRRGGDYMFIQLALREGIDPRSQADFDALIAERRELDDHFHGLFYRARHELLAAEPERWYALNPLYPGMAELLGRYGGDGRFLILSTKEAAFIEKILAFNGIAWDASRICCSGKEEKRSFIDRIMDERMAERAIFIDDQIDHFKGASRHELRCLLADWGYVREDWLEDTRTEHVTLGQLDTLFRHSL
jgi:phosphoglycolate phosphatase-like HAD superfamily hydrolase